jgi:hypothetical protein
MMQTKTTAKDNKNTNTSKEPELFGPRRVVLFEAKPNERTD